jgi:hypothetical protein
MTDVSLLPIGAAVVQIAKSVVNHFAHSFCIFHAAVHLSLKIGSLKSLDQF